MRMILTILLAAVALSCVSCRTRDVRTVLIYVPEMKNAACAEIVKNTVSKMAGVDAAKTTIDLQKHTVIVHYDSLITALKNIEFGISEAGFKANEVPANGAAAMALPPECRN